MENAEEIMHSLEEFSKLKPKDIPHELDDYLGYVARTGDPVFKWSIIKCLFREKLLNVITDFYESTLTIELPPCPNVDPFNYERMKANLLEKLDSFHGAPFTVQRISELLTNPRKEYNRADKFMRAIEKNILVVSTREPGREADAESYNGMPDTNDSGVETGFPCNDFSDPDCSTQSYKAKTEQVVLAYQVADAAEGPSSMTDEGPSIPVTQEVHALPSTVVEEKDPESVICTSSASEASHPPESTERLAPGSGECGESRQEAPVVSTSEPSFDHGHAQMEPSPSTSAAEHPGFSEEPARVTEGSPVVPIIHPVEELVLAQKDTHETSATAIHAEEVSTSDMGSSAELDSQENLAREEDTSAEAVPLSTETPGTDLQCAETASFEDDRPSQSESANSQSDSAASQSDFLSQSESSGSDSNPSGEEPLPSEPAPVQVQDLTPEPEPIEVKVSFEAESSVPTVYPPSEGSGDTPTIVEAQVTSCEEPQPSEPIRAHPEPALPLEAKPEPELKLEVDSGDQTRETSVIHTTSSDVHEPMEVDDCQTPEKPPLNWYVSQSVGTRTLTPW